jgi:hypothetical protein
MQSLKHYKDGRIEVTDTAAGFACSFQAGAYDALQAALTYARTLPPQDDLPQDKSRSRGGRRRKASLPGQLELPMTTPAALPPVEASEPKPPGALAQAISTALATTGECTALALADLPTVTAHIATTNSRVQRSVVASTLARMVKAGAVINVGDRYKVA